MPVPDAEHQAAAAVVEDVALGVLVPAVVAVVVAAHGDRGQPEHLGLFQHGRGDLDALGGGGDVHGPDVGQLQRGRQVDRQRPVVGLRGRESGEVRADGGSWSSRQDQSGGAHWRRWSFLPADASGRGAAGNGQQAAE